VSARWAASLSGITCITTRGDALAHIDGGSTTYDHFKELVAQFGSDAWVVCYSEDFGSGPITTVKAVGPRLVVQSTGYVANGMPPLELVFP
jgi:hypothetical protein